MLFASYDTNSLTNIPLKETTKLGVALLPEKEPKLRMSKNDFKKLFEIATCETRFMFKNMFYE